MLYKQSKIVVTFLLPDARHYSSVLPCVPELGSVISNSLDNSYYTVDRVEYTIALESGPFAEKTIESQMGNDKYQPSIVISLAELA